jgi:hypothetical protein
MKDIARFKKLFEIKTPCEEHFDYYISVLSRTHKFYNIYEIIELYEQAESEYENFNDWSHKKSNEIIDYLKSTITYQRLIDCKLPQVSYNKKPFKPEIGKKYLSIDMRKANWQIFKYKDETGELPQTYEEFLDFFNCHEVLKYSKNYRQFIFGNLNPKRQQSIQASIMQSLATIMNSESGISYKVEDLKHDELIISDYTDSVYGFVETRKFDFRMDEFVAKRVDNLILNEYYELGTDNLIYKELKGAPGNRKYINLKKYILEEPIELRDLYFRDNDSLALWADDLELLKGLL